MHPDEFMALPECRPVDVLLENLEITAKTVVDVGCGHGGLVRRLARHGAKVIGIECGADALRAARASEPVADEQYLEGVGQSLPLPDASADIIVFANSLHHVPVKEMPTALAEAARVLKTGGFVYVQEPVAAGDYFVLMKPIDDETDIRAAAQTALQSAGSAGFIPVSDIRFRMTQSFTTFEEFRESMGQVDPARLPVIDAMIDSMKQRFGALGERSSDGRRSFSQPMKVDILQKAG